MLPSPKKLQDAFTIAQGTAQVPHGGAKELRNRSNLRIAKEARHIFREWKRAHPLANPPPLEDDDDEHEEGAIRAQMKRRDGARLELTRGGADGGRALDPSMLAALAMEFDDEDFGEEEFPPDFYDTITQDGLDA